MLDDIVEKGLRPLELPTIDGLSGLSGVLEAYTQVGAARAGALRGVNLRRGVSNLQMLVSMCSSGAEVVRMHYHCVVGDGVGLLDLSGILSQDFDLEFESANENCAKVN